MGCIVQRLSTIADADTVSISFWCIPPVENLAFFSMYLFGIVAQDGGITFSLSYDKYSTGTSDFIITGGSSDNIHTIEWIAKPASFQYGSWNHIFVAADVSEGGASDRAYVYINGVRQQFLVFTGTGDIYADTTAPYDNGSKDFSVPFTFGISGCDIAVPTTPEYITGQPKIQYAEFQAWFGKFIDPTDPANFSKFVSITNNVGRPVNPATAAAAFGTQDLLFKGGASSFFNNVGTGGTFTKTGTLSDYTPGPTY